MDIKSGRRFVEKEFCVAWSKLTEVGWAYFRMGLFIMCFLNEL